MPELPEVEVLARHLDRTLRGRTIRRAEVMRPRIIRPQTVPVLTRVLEGSEIRAVNRRAKYLVWRARAVAGSRQDVSWVVHLGMSGRILVRPPRAAPLRHTAVSLDLGDGRVDFVDPRGFGRWNLELGVLDALGPEPLETGFTVELLAVALHGSRQAVKVRLLDQAVLAGVGNIYASEALFRARLSPLRPAGRVRAEEVARLWHALREVLSEAIRFGSTVPLDFTGEGTGDGLFYHGLSEGGSEGAGYEERLRVYDREGQPCVGCGGRIRRWVQAARSTYGCPRCQR